jgi:hypothetical protein
VEVASCELNDEPQCMQNAAPVFTVPPQRGQVPVSSTALEPLPVGCTGVPHSGQNFLPVTSWPQEVQVAMDFHLPYD